MDDLLKKELEFTKKFITDPSEINKENLLDIKLNIHKYILIKSFDLLKYLFLLLKIKFNNLYNIRNFLI